MPRKFIELAQHYPAPIDRVWKVWTEAKQIKAWWGSKDFTATTYLADPQPGGAWTATIAGPVR